MKADILTDPTHVRRLEEAAQWVLRLQSDAPTERDTAEWLHWCEAADENLAAFEQVQRDWHDLGALRAIPASRTGPRRRTPLWIALAASLVGAVLMYLLRPTPAVHEAFTAVRTNHTATLPDGSSVVLGPRTLVDVDFSGANRRLTLTRGEAYFRVHHDKRRPFVVQAGELSVTAVGTAFDIRREPERVVVTVEEGTVEVESPADSAGAAPNTWAAEAGYQLVYIPGIHAASLVNVNPAQVLKWRDGELAYVGEPLGTVIADVNRYSEHRIRIDDPELAALRYTGTVFTGSVGDWLKAVEAAYPVRVEGEANGDLILRRSR